MLVETQWLLKMMHGQAESLWRYHVTVEWAENAIVKLVMQKIHFQI